VDRKAETSGLLRSRIAESQPGQKKSLQGGNEDLGQGSSFSWITNSGALYTLLKAETNKQKQRSREEKDGKYF